MHALVTGAAGFIGSHVVEHLLADGHQVTGIDNFDPYYARAIKERNLAEVQRHPEAKQFRFVEGDLLDAPLDTLLDGVDVIIDLAARAGVRASWGASFAGYLRANVQATQRLLEAAKDVPTLQRYVYGGSSSVYGNKVADAVGEDFPAAPHSPYGLTKWAAEQLGGVYRRVFDVPFCVARIFSCYGPRERPDKAIQKFMLATANGERVTLYGDGTQRRDFSFVGDIASGLVACAKRLPPGEVVNLARGEAHSMNDLLAAMQEVMGRELLIDRGPSEAGDVRVTFARIDKARDLVGYAPRVSIHEGLAAQWAHVLANDGAPA